MSTESIIRISGPSILLHSIALLCPVVYLRYADLSISYIDVIFPVIAVYVVVRISRIPIQYYIYILYCGVAMLSSSFSTYGANDFQSIVLAIRLIAISAPLALVFAMKNFDEGIAVSVYKFALCGAGFATVLGIVLHLSGVQIRDTQQQLWLGAGYGSVLRAGGIVGNSGEYGQISALFGLLLVGSSFVGVRVTRTALYCGLVVVLYAMLISSSRAALVMFAVGGISMVVLSKRKIVEYTLMSAIGIGAIALSIYVVGIDKLPVWMKTSIYRLDILNITGNSNFVSDVRLENWAYVVENIGSRPGLGFGYKQFEDYAGFYVDNAFLLALVETGVVGAIFFSGFWIVLLVKFAARSVAGSRVAILAFAVTVSFVVRMMTGGANAGWSVAPLMFLIIGVAWRLDAGRITSGYQYVQHSVPVATR